MATTLSMKELRSMQQSDLQKELQSQRAVVAKLAIGIQMQKEKDTAKYRREKKVLSRMMTALGEKNPTTPTKPTSPKKAASPSSVSSASSPKKPAFKKSSKKPKIPTP